LLDGNLVGASKSARRGEQARGEERVGCEEQRVDVRRGKSRAQGEESKVQGD
jgi:hypothetical protein